MTPEEYYRAKLEKLENSGDRIFIRPDLPQMPHKFHIIGICGTAMGALAGLLDAKGHLVTGSDKECHPPISDMLSLLGIDVFTGEYLPEHISDAHVVVVGNVSTPDNPEAKFARENNLPQVTLPEALEKFIFHDKKRLVVAGTHGKTTTTGLLVHILETAKKSPGYMIGGIPQGKSNSFSLAGGDFAVLEGDEYDTAYFDKSPKFLNYGAHSAIITSMELDHLDIYKDFEDYKQAFKFFIQSIPAEGKIVMSDSYPELVNLAQFSNAEVILYGSEGRSARNVTQEGEYQVFDYLIDNEVHGILKTPLSGKHNIENILAATTLALESGIEFEDIAKAVLTFTGMKRRQEILRDISGITVMNDFAHHPTAVSKTLEGLKKKYGERRIIALFEPGSNTSRKKVFEEDYTKSFGSADYVYIKMPKVKENQDENDSMNGEYVASEISKKGIEARFSNDVDVMLRDLDSVLREGDVVVFMTNSTFDGAQEKLIERLGSR